MGIPAYFSYIVKNHINIIRKLSQNNIKIDNFYLDCNSIIYDAVYKLDATRITSDVSHQIISSVIEKIKEYIRLLAPNKLVYIAFDGVGPVAKLEQQRSRRYKSIYQNNISKTILKSKNPDPWNTTAITPGTLFMKTLNERIESAFNNPSEFNLASIIVSGSDVVGEGEHKIFEYMRNNSDKVSNANNIIYGLDADLIMLSINHLPIVPNIYLFRETPEFIKSISSELEPNENYVLDIPELSSAIISNMNNGSDRYVNRVYDYILLCFFLGNDFMPHFPAINIRIGGVDKMLLAYKQTFGDTDEVLTDGKTINWKNVRKLIAYLAVNEEEYLKQVHRSRDRKEKMRMPDITPEEKMELFINTPTYDRVVEKYINPYKPNWQRRYYKSLFDVEIDDCRRKQICMNYLEGLEWTMKYYTSGCPDWRWCYKYNYPPLLSDLIHYVPYFDAELVPDKKPNPVSDLVQLSYVLPKQSLHFLPEKVYKGLLTEKSNWYNTECDFSWAYCKYFWESHPNLPHIDIDELEKFVGGL